MVLANNNNNNNQVLHSELVEDLDKDSLVNNSNNNHQLKDNKPNKIKDSTK